MLQCKNKDIKVFETLMLITHLPCKNCGNSLPIVKGSKAQCPYCGARTLYMESIYLLKHYLAIILNLTSIKIQTSLKNKEIERRKYLIGTFFSKLKTSFNEYRHLIITKLDDIEINPKKLFFLIRSAGTLELVIDKFLLPYLNEDNIKTKYKDFRDFSFVINKTLLGLYYSFLAKNSKYIEKCFNYYKLVEKNYQNIVDYCNITYLENNKSKLHKKKELYIILTGFTKILRNILNKNPKHFSVKLENLLTRLERMDEKTIQTYHLYSQIDHIYQLERDTSVLIEKVKIDNPISTTNSLEENIMFNTEENLKQLNTLRDLIKNLSDKYQNYQRNLLKLHSGELINYLESYRTEFINYKNRNVEKFNNLLETMILKAFKAYNTEVVEVMNTLSDFVQNDILNDRVIERFEIEQKDLVYLDEILQKFINDLFKKSLLWNLESDYYKKLISLISGKHTEFDRYILKYTILLFKKFEELRNKKILTLEEQKNQFSIELKPNLQKLIDLSFNLNEKVVTYPLFIDIKSQNKRLRANEPETITLIIENPNLTDIKDINIHFFIPKSFHSKLKFTSIKKLKAKERRRIKIKVIPSNNGSYLFMVDILFKHINKTFWMPSIKLELDVEDIVINKYHLTTNADNYHNGLEITRVLTYIRNHAM